MRQWSRGDRGADNGEVAYEGQLRHPDAARPPRASEVARPGTLETAASAWFHGGSFVVRPLLPATLVNARIASLLFLSSVLAACGGSVDKTGLGPAPTTAVTGAPTPGPAPTTGPARPPTTTPATWNPQASGCSNVFVFDGDSTGKRFLVISGDRTTLGLKGLSDSYTANLGAAEPIHVYVDTFTKPPVEPPYCTDIVYADAEKPVKSRAVQGQATITITSVGRDTDSYAIDVVLKGVVVKGPNGLETIPDMTFKSVGVGWLPG
jgi:hypothetical protein